MNPPIGKLFSAAATIVALSLPQGVFGAYGDQGTLSMSNYAYGGTSFSIVSPSRTGNVGVGGFTASYDANFGATPAPTSFVAYCIDLAQSFSWAPFSFTVTETNPNALFGNPQKATVLDRLFTQHFAEANTSSKSAAFQLAVWEAITEVPGGTYAFDGGLFKATGNSDTIAMATGWLNNLTGESGLYTLTALVGPNNQDQIMATPVPEPQTYMMLLAGLGLMGFVARRRQRDLAA